MKLTPAQERTLRVLGHFPNVPVRVHAGYSAPGPVVHPKPTERLIVLGLARQRHGAGYYPKTVTITNEGMVWLAEHPKMAWLADHPKATP